MELEGQIEIPSTAQLFCISVCTLVFHLSENVVTPPKGLHEVTQVTISLQGDAILVIHHLKRQPLLIFIKVVVVCGAGEKRNIKHSTTLFSSVTLHEPKLVTLAAFPLLFRALFTFCQHLGG